MLVSQLQEAFGRGIEAIGRFLRGRKNLLEVKVSKMSANATVNEAERSADFWVFGGIFRPVWLQAFPKEYIDRIAINARADGQFTVDVFPGHPQPGREISVRLLDRQGNPVGKTFTSQTDITEMVRVSGSLPSPETWTPEFPNLYTMVVSLGDGTTLLHRVTEKFGFRTLELRERDGFYVNGQKIRFKGINHHSFWPTSGRTTSRKISVEDVKLIREMNMNAVRMSHYPPDAHFLDVCALMRLRVFLLSPLLLETAGGLRSSFPWTARVPQGPRAGNRS